MSADRERVDVAGGSLYVVVDEAPGPPVLMVHGAMDRSSSFARLRRHLSDHRVIRYDRRGYGRSVDLGPPASLKQQIADLAAVVEATCDRPPSVFGHSYGGTVALAASHRGVALAGVVAYESPLPWLPWWPTSSAGATAMQETGSPEDGAERFMRRMIGDRRWERLPPSTRAARRKEGAALRAELAHVRPPFDDGPPFDPATLDVPLVTAHGTASKDHHVQAMRTLAETVPGAWLVVVPGAGHGVHLTHPAAAAALVTGLDAG